MVSWGSAGLSQSHYPESRHGEKVVVPRSPGHAGSRGGSQSSFTTACPSQQELGGKSRSLTERMIQVRSSLLPRLWP